MEKMEKQILPSGLVNKKTTMYAYNGEFKSTSKGSVGFPIPAVFATKYAQTIIKWTNNIKGKHILPVITTPPFIPKTPNNQKQVYENEVPTVPYVHGVATVPNSDGRPLAYWTSTGNKGQQFYTKDSPNSNQAIYVYPN